MNQWIVACLPHPPILAVLSFEIFVADHSHTQTFDKRIYVASMFNHPKSLEYPNHWLNL